MRFIIIGTIGSDAGYTIINSDGTVTHVPGWQPEALAEFSRGVTILSEAAQLKTPRLGESIIKTALASVQKELEGRVQPGDVIVVR
jgi:hypothetical protein